MSTQETKKVLTIVDRSTKSLNAAAESAQKVIQDLNSVVSIATNLATDIEFKQSELLALDDQFAIKEREQAADLKLRVRENEEKVLNELLASRKLTAVSPDVLQNLEKTIVGLQQNENKVVSDAIKATEEKLVGIHSTEVTSIQSAHQVEIATLKATNSSLNERVQFLTIQNTKLEEQLNAERETRIAIAQAESTRQGVVVNTTK